SSPAARLTNLPKPLTSFIGRKHQVQELVQIISNTSLVTVTVTGGIGKTRLAIQLGRALTSEFADGVWWADLSPLTQENLVAAQIAKALGVQERLQQDL